MIAVIFEVYIMELTLFGLSRIMETTEGVIVGSGQRFNFASVKNANSSNKTSYYVYYMYSVKGKQYLQGSVTYNDILLRAPYVRIESL